MAVGSNHNVSPTKVTLPFEMDINQVTPTFGNETNQQYVLLGTFNNTILKEILKIYKCREMTI